MGVGGRVIELLPMQLEETEVVRVWVKDMVSPDDELAVYVEPFSDPNGPRLGESVWWQSGWLYFDNDRRRIRKIGYSFDPRRAASKGSTE